MGERVANLEAIEEIKKLMAFYAWCADRKYTDDYQRQPQAELDRVAREQASIFTKDAIWDGGPNFGRFRRQGADL